MPRIRRIAALDRAADSRAKRKKSRERKRALKAPGQRKRRSAVAKALACVFMLAAFTALGFAVGNGAYQATLIGWVPCTMLLCGIGLGALYAAVLRRGVRHEEELAAPECQRDSDIVFTINFKNTTPLLATRMKSTFFIAGMFDNVAYEASTTLSLAPFEEYDMPLTTRFEHIGTFHAGLKEYTVSDFLGLFTYTVQNKANQLVRVTPKIVELDGISFSNEAMDEAMKAARSVLADSMDYAYVREYEQGDPLKTIHWKLSARSNEYMTRLYEVYTNPSVVIVMDFYGPSEEAADLMSMFDAVVESAFSLARYARKKGMDTELHFVDKHGVEQSLQSVDSDKVSEAVADMPRMSNDPADASAALDIVKRQTSAARGFNNIFVCSANMSSEMVSAIVEAKVRRRTPHFVAVVPPSLVGRERDDYCANLARLDASDIGFSVISHVGELGFAVGGES